MSSSRRSWHRLGLLWYMIHHYPLLVLHGISQWWRVYCIVIIFAWINFVWNVLVLLLKKQKQGVWHDLMMGSLLQLNSDHRIGLVCDTGLEVQLIDVRRRYPASIGKKIISVFALSAGPRPSAGKKWVGPASFLVGPASFPSFSCLKVGKDEIKAGKSSNPNNVMTVIYSAKKCV